MTFYLDARSGAPPYRQIIRQVRDAVLLGRLHEGDQLPTVKEVAECSGLNPNTVLRAYKELEYAGLAVPKVGLGTFVAAGSHDPSLSATLMPLRQDLLRWFANARRAGLDDETIEALSVGVHKTNTSSIHR